MSPADTPDRDEDLADLLAELETTLTELRGELRAGGRNAPDPLDRRGSPDRPDRRDTPERRSAPDRRRDRSGLPRPPSVSELFRFTEQYTLPTLISTLEATIRALELLRGTLRLVDGRSAFDDADRRGRSSTARLGDGVAGVGREAVSGVERALSELEAALSESDIPNERAGDDLLGEARALSAEITDRLDAAQEGSRRRSDSPRDREQPGRGAADTPDRGSDAVTIEVTDSDGGGHETDADDGGGHETDADAGAERHPEVDIDAELESIRHEVRGTDGSGESEGDETGGDSGAAGDRNGSEEATEESGGTAGDGHDDDGSGGSDATDAATDDRDDTDDSVA